LEFKSALNPNSNSGPGIGPVRIWLRQIRTGRIIGIGRIGIVSVGCLGRIRSDSIPLGKGCSPAELELWWVEGWFRIPIRLGRRRSHSILLGDGGTPAELEFVWAIRLGRIRSHSILPRVGGAPAQFQLPELTNRCSGERMFDAVVIHRLSTGCGKLWISRGGLWITLLACG
jgi:hypothetical protein